MTFSILTIILIGTVLVSLSAFNNSKLRDDMMYIPYDVKHNKNYKRIFTHILIHSDYMHLAFNMMSLYFLGSLFLDTPCHTYLGRDCGLIQSYGEFQGQLHFLILYVFGGLFAALIPYLRNQDNPNYRSLGASGAVSAVIFAAILWNPSMNLYLFFIPIGIPAYIFGPLYLAFEYYSHKKGNSGIAHDAHIGGALFGIVYVLIINIDKGKEFLNYFV
ncbi:MAG: rhomboid family intramembrane serine protease [Crocinitomicaceae bacterium]|nr:rhomboid family intramembrane serine protease [Crocinitomicaceae bacterium]